MGGPQSVRLASLTESRGRGEYLKAMRDEVSTTGGRGRPLEGGGTELTFWGGLVMLPVLGAMLHAREQQQELVAERSSI